MTDQIQEQLVVAPEVEKIRILSLEEAKIQKDKLDADREEIMKTIKRKLVEEIPDQENRELLRSLGEDVKDITEEELNKRETLIKMSDNFDHDYEGSTKPLWVLVEEGLVTEEMLGKPFDKPISSSLVEVPRLIIHRTKNFLNGTEVSKSEFKFSDQLDLMDNFFSVAIGSRGKVYTNINQSFEQTLIAANKEDVVSALVNVLNNSKREIVKNKKGNNIGINLVKDKEGNMLLELFDDAGGFSEDMKATTKVKTKDGREVEKAKAFMRNVSGSGSTGFGLDMVWETFVENMGCEINIDNRQFKYFDPQKKEVVNTGKIGAVTTIKFPKRRI